MYNSITLLGRISKDIELKYLTSEGIPLLKFDVAVNRKVKKNEYTTDFYPVEIWGAFGETLSNKLNKGQQVFIVGEGKNQTWKDDAQQVHKRFIVVAKFLKVIDYDKNKLCSLTNEDNEFSLMQNAYDEGTF